MKSLRHPATILAGLALLVALVGNGYASSLINGKLLKNGSVTGQKLANKTVAGGKLADASVSSTKLADGSVSSAKLAPGAVGPAAVAAGAIGLSKLDSTVTGKFLAATTYTNVQNSGTVPGSQHFALAAMCPTGTRVVGGGVDTTTSTVLGSYPNGYLEWIGWVVNNNSQPDTMYVYAICASQ